MKLVDLDPTWITVGGRTVGIRFVCPIDDGAGPHREGHQVAVLFANPPDGGSAHPDDPQVPGNNNGNRWARSGDTFATLTLSPSVDCTSSDAHCWHGHIIGGVVS